MSHKSTGPADHQKRILIRKLHKTKIRIWKDVSERLQKPRNNQAKVNIYRINKKTQDGDVIVIPGKVLGMGDLDHKVTIAAYKASESAKNKVENSSTGSKIIGIDTLLEENPKGSNVKIFI